MQIQFTLFFTQAGSWGTRSSFPLCSPSIRRRRAACSETQLFLSCSVRNPCRPPVSPALLSPSPEQGRRGLSFMVEGAAASRPSRHPISGMSSLVRHYDSSVTLPSRMGAFTQGIAVGSPHNSNRLHSSVWEKSPPVSTGFT